MLTRQETSVGDDTAQGLCELCSGQRDKAGRCAFEHKYVQLSAIVR